MKPRKNISNILKINFYKNWKLRGDKKDNTSMI